ncbi:MAG: VWA domain-containing protein [Cytophagaceae bacterium]|jgi:Mg-chelatase subunit ChlD|nr:VWA domain-containing protein [Cytophagaceae bacterium]
MDELERKWRLVLGAEVREEFPAALSGIDSHLDKTLEALYNAGDRKGGLGPSSPNVARWLGDIREYFPASVVKVLQQDALKRLQLTSMLTEPEMLESVVPDVHLVANLMSLGKLIPEKTKATARRVVQRVVQELMDALQAPTQQAVQGSLHRSTRNRRPRMTEMDWHSTILKNLKHYQPEYHTVIPETRIGYGRKRKSLKEVVLCIDQSGSMGTSVVYAGIFGAVLASIPALHTRMVVFDTEVADLTEQLNDPVELLFGVQLGGGTDIARALRYCEQVVERPADTVLVLISDLFEGGQELEMKKTVTQLVAAGVQIIVLLALNDEGAPSYDHANASFFAGQGVSVFACTPNHFPSLMAAALSKQDVAGWASALGIVQATVNA